MRQPHKLRHCICERCIVWRGWQALGWVQLQRQAQSDHQFVNQAGPVQPDLHTMHSNLWEGDAARPDDAGSWPYSMVKRGASNGVHRPLLAHQTKHLRNTDILCGEHSQLRSHAATQLSAHLLQGISLHSLRDFSCDGGPQQVMVL